ncbi:MAG: NAD(P)-binding domain-containing protein, partial [Anaerolineae bacterium]|nr:NAD(P)-binding domain-containing protein [Anaerolineae bacterium]
MTHYDTLMQRLNTREARIGIIGLGYVGLPLAVEFAEAGFTVVGIDVLPDKVAQLNSGHSYIADIPSERLAPLVKAGKFVAST